VGAGGDDPWGELDAFLAALCGEVGGKAYALFDSSWRQLLPFVESAHLAVELRDAQEALEARFGAAALKRGSASRYAHAEPGNVFAALPLLSAYTLIVLCRTGSREGAESTSGGLARAEARLSDMIARLPPENGGPAAIAGRQPGR
jgi:hypothetical protein